MTKSYLGVSEHVVYPFLPNGFADHYPKNKWLFHWEYTLFSDKPIQWYVPLSWERDTNEEIGSTSFSEIALMATFD